MGEFSEIDWPSVARHIAALTEEKQRLQADSKDLDELTRRLDKIAGEIKQQEAAYASATQSWGRIDGERDADASLRDEARAILTEPPATDAQAHLPALQHRLTEARLSCATAKECARAEARLREEGAERRNRWNKEQTRLAQAIASQMRTFRTDYLAETNERDDSVASAGGYRALHRQPADRRLRRHRPPRQYRIRVHTEPFEHLWWCVHYPLADREQ